MKNNMATDKNMQATNKNKNLFHSQETTTGHKTKPTLTGNT